jgi:hypothetical protein
MYIKEILKMRFKIGDNIRIKKDLEVYKFYGKISVFGGMTTYLGKEAIIKEVNDECYKLDIDNLTWRWTDEMLEEIYQKPREYQTGDIVFYKNDFINEELIGIVYGDRITYTSSGRWSDLKEVKEYIIKYIPVENIQRVKYMSNISKLLEEKIVHPCLEQYIVQVKQKEKAYNVYQVEFSKDSEQLHNFITETNQDIKVGDIIECNVDFINWKYGKVINITQEELSDKEFNQYRKCRKSE